MKSYYRVMLGQGGMHAKKCFAENFIGADFQIHQDLTGKLPDNWREFNLAFIPVYLAIDPTKRRSVLGWHAERCGWYREAFSRKIWSFEHDQRIRRALTMTPNIVFYRYQVSFKLVKA